MLSTWIKSDHVTEILLDPASVAPVEDAPPQVTACHPFAVTLLYSVPARNGVMN